MSETNNREVLDAIAAMHAQIDSRLDDQERHTERIVADQIEMRAELAGAFARLEALESARAAHDNRLSAHERKIVDGIAEAKRMVSDVESKLEDTLAAVDDRQTELAVGMHETKTVVDGIATEMHEWKADAKTAVLNALDEHVTKIEAAAETVARSPAVKTAASVGGAFAGSAVVAAIIEALKHVL